MRALRPALGREPVHRGRTGPRRIVRAALGIGLACLGLLGCSPVDLLNALSSDSGVTTSLGLAYGPGLRRGLDVYAPTGATGAPTVVFFYGGTWQEGRRADYAFVGRALARQGFVTVIPDYRLYPEVKFEGFMRDGAAAIAWARRNAARFGGDPHRLVLMGHSAGALISTLLALDGRWLAPHGLVPARDLAGAVGLAGPYDFLPIEDPVLQVIFGPPAKLADTQAVTFANGRNPPLFLATGDEDTTVRPRNTEGLAARVRAAGGSVQERTYPGIDHRTLIGVVSGPLGGTAPVIGDIATFIRGLARTP